VAQDNAILRHFAAKISSSEILLAKEIRPWKENLFQWQPRILEQSYWHSMFPMSVVKLPNTSECSQNSWQPSRDLVSVLCSLVSYILPLITQLSWLPLFLCITLLTQCTMIDPPHSGEWNKNGIGCSPDHFPCVMKNGLGTRQSIGF